MVKQIQTYAPTAECSICQGNCCKRLPGPYHPSDFKHPITPKYLLKLLKNRRGVVDWWERRGSPGYFLRPPTADDGNRYFHGSWGGTCTFLAAQGCLLLHKERPLGCRTLKPRTSETEECTSPYDKYEAYRAWAKHLKIIEEVRETI